MKFLLATLSLLAGAALAPISHGQEIPLYETGPSEDSAFIRFVNSTDAALVVKAEGSKTSLPLDAGKPASNFLPVPAKRALKGQFVQGDAHAPTETTVEPGEFATVIALPAGKGGLAVQTIRETPDDFNALKASVGLYNLAPACADATVKAAGRNVTLFSGVAVGEPSKRLQINPVPLSVQLFCAGRETGEPVSLGTLEAGERYTLFLVPAGDESRLFHAVDAVSF